MPSFENLHKNKKLAFLDGFLTAAAISGFAFLIWKEDHNDATRAEKVDYAQKRWMRGYRIGFNDGIRDAARQLHYPEGHDKLVYMPED